MSCVILRHADDGRVSRIIAVSHRDVLDSSSRIGPSKNQGNFNDVSVFYNGTLLSELIREDRHSVNVAMLNQFACVFSLLAPIKEAVGVDAITSVLEHCVTENIGDFAVTVLPNKRHNGPIVLRECIVADSSTIATLNAGNSGPAVEVGLASVKIHRHCHFEPPVWILRLQSLCTGSPTDQP